MKGDRIKLANLRPLDAWAEARLYFLLGSFADGVAGFEVFEVVAHHPLADLHHVEDPLVGDRIVCVPAFAAGLHVAAP